MSGESPYREGKPLRDVIAPDRRRQKALLLVAGGILGGLAIAEGLRALREPTKTIEVEVVPPIPAATVLDPSAEPPRERTQVELVKTIASYRPKVFSECWERENDPKLTSAKVAATVTIGEAGNVVAVTSTSDAPVVASCVEGQIRTWHFAATGMRQTTRVPFEFRRE